jgi:hypothetical protein
MTRGGSTLLIVSALLASGAPALPARAQSETVSMTLVEPSAARMGVEQSAASIVATVKDFGWLTGTWRGEWGPRVAEVVWTAPQSGVMTGAFSLMETDKVLVIELFTLVQTPSGVDLYIRHFTPELAAWEKSGPTRLTTASFDAKQFEFDNAVDGKPKKFVFSRADGDTYVARSEIVPDTGDEQVIEITYHRVVPVTVAAPSKKKK